PSPLLRRRVRRLLAAGVGRLPVLALAARRRWGRRGCLVGHGSPSLRWCRRDRVDSPLSVAYRTPQGVVALSVVDCHGALVCAPGAAGTSAGSAARPACRRSDLREET